MGRFLRSTRGRLVVFQGLVLAVASFVTAFVIYQSVSVPARAQADSVLYDQWSAIAGGLSLQDGQVVHASGPLPETSGDSQIPVEAELYTKDGPLLQTSKHVMPAAQVQQFAERALGGHGTGTALDVRDPSGSPRRLYADQSPVGDPNQPVQVAIVVSRSTAELEASLRRLLLLLIGGGLAVVVVGAALAWFVVGRTLRGVRGLAGAARSISEQDLHRRVDVPTPDDELGELKATFNQMLGRLEQSFEGLRRFTADASHELRSPLTLIRTEVDVALDRSREPGDYERVLRAVQSEAEHMSRVVDQLLLLAQADAGTLAPLRTEIDVADLLEERAARWRPVAGARGVGLEVTTPAAGTLAGDPDLLRRVVDNLLDNAIRYSPSLASVKLSAAQEGDGWLIEVADEGPGVPPDLRARIFDRFSRADTVRTRRGEGAGLGLALGAAVACAHGGSLVLAERDGSGATFQLRLPV